MRINLSLTKKATTGRKNNSAKPAVDFAKPRPVGQPAEKIEKAKNWKKLLGIYDI